MGWSILTVAGSAWKERNRSATSHSRAVGIWQASSFGRFRRIFRWRRSSVRQQVVSVFAIRFEDACTLFQLRFRGDRPGFAGGKAGAKIFTRFESWSMLEAI
jgi:hypothetical protein